ncbi:hypothetical protein E2562_013572 [Oryza meyeriana var. granulata]|uniref:Uncharacterized protein n=1 Tax=Oryza meyeriana var. granulata TaxID=110450 RepID=A0A6G1C5M1_9ORYZ|nr:hypothetical protein E2562_013572 [Oryza meyeriana var. granulata]
MVGGGGEAEEAWGRDLGVEGGPLGAAGLGRWQSRGGREGLSESASDDDGDSEQDLDSGDLGRPMHTKGTEELPPGAHLHNVFHVAADYATAPTPATSFPLQNAHFVFVWHAV